MKGDKKTVKEGLTPRQLDIYKEIVDFIKGNKYSPSYEEMKQLNGLRSKSNVHAYVYGLKKRGYLDIISYSKRSIVVL